MSEHTMLFYISYISWKHMWTIVNIQYIAFVQPDSSSHIHWLHHPHHTTKILWRTGAFNPQLWQYFSQTHGRSLVLTLNYNFRLIVPFLVVLQTDLLTHGSWSWNNMVFISPTLLYTQPRMHILVYLSCYADSTNVILHFRNMNVLGA
jgi:hypothetical protein